MEKTEYIIRDDGIDLRRITETPVDLTAGFFGALAEYAVFHRTNSVHIPGWGLANVRFHKELDYYTMPMDRIHLRTAWHVSSDGFMVPDFHNESNNPRLEMVWKTPEDMKLVMLFSISCNESSKVYKVELHWLIAYKVGDSTAYRLPLANIHDDGRVCDDIEGRGVYRGPTPADAILAAMTKFAQSEWNHDLLTSSAHAQSMFRFKAKDKIHEQLNAGRWWNLCAVIAPDILGEVMV